MKISNILTLGVDVKTKSFLFLLCLMFIDYAGYGYYFFYLPFIYLVLHKGYNLIDKNFLILFVWGMSYGLTNWVNTGTLSYGSIIVPMINMPVIYIMGKYLAYYNKKESLVIILFLLALSLASISLFSVFKDISINGFSGVGVQRNVPLIGITNAEGYIAATGISSRLMPLAFFYVFLLCPYDKISKYMFVGTSLLAMCCLLRVQSRTSVVGCTIVLFCLLFFTWKSRSIKQRFLLLLGLCLIIISVAYILVNYSGQLDIINRFQDDDVQSGGGRVERKLKVLSEMINYPFGAMDATYAHDIWLDCARVSGIIPFTLLLSITIKYLKNLYSFFKHKHESWILRVTIGIISLALFIVFGVEPVLEGIPMCFGLFSLLYGVLIIFNKSPNRSYIK